MLASPLPGASNEVESVRHADLERCASEQAEMMSMGTAAPAWLVILGIEDWECEKRLIEAAISPVEPAPSDVKTNTDRGQ
jgi:hypothetical protein